MLKDKNPAADGANIFHESGYDITMVLVIFYRTQEILVRGQDYMWLVK